MNMNTEKLHVRFRGRVAGPFTREQLTRMASRGQITRMHEISEDGQNWANAVDAGIVIASAPASRRPVNRAEAASQGIELAPTYATNTQPTQPAIPACFDEPEPEPQPHAAMSAIPAAESDQMQWYYAANNSQIGPIPTKLLTQMVQSGQITPDTRVWREGMAQWVAASQVEDLFTIAGAGSRVNAAGNRSTPIVWASFGAAVVAIITAAIVVPMLTWHGGVGQQSNANHEGSIGRPAGVSKSSAVGAATIAIHGSAWVTVGSGDSRIIRGMHVYVIGPELINNREIWDLFTRSLKSSIETFDELKRNDGLSESIRDVAADQRRNADKVIAKIDNIKNTKNVSTKLAYNVMRDAIAIDADGESFIQSGRETLRKEDKWPQLSSSGVIASCYTDASGKFEISGEFPEGSFIYATYETSAKVIEWLVPINGISENKHIKIDLFYDNVGRTFTNERIKIN